MNILAEVLMILAAVANIADRHWVMKLTARRQENDKLLRQDTLRSLRERAEQAHDVENTDSITVRPAKKPYAYAEGL